MIPNILREQHSEGLDGYFTKPSNCKRVHNSNPFYNIKDVCDLSLSWYHNGYDGFVFEAFHKGDQNYTVAFSSKPTITKVKSHRVSLF